MSNLENKPLEPWAQSGLKNNNPRGDLQSVKRCSAINRNGNVCRCPAIRSKSKCRLHGGASTGPKTKIGKQRSRRNALKQGYYSLEAQGKWKELQGFSGAIANIQRHQKKLFPQIHAHLCSLLYEKQNISESEFHHALQLSQKWKQAMIVADKIVNEMTKSAFIERLNILQKFRLHFLLQKSQYLSFESIIERQRICELKSLVEATNDEGYFCKPLPSSLNPKNWRLCRM